VDFTVPAARFGSMDWVIEKLGPQAITYPNQKEYARAAIQASSLTSEECTVFTHSGWRQVRESQRVFLDGGGAIGANGRVPNLHVQLPSGLSGYQLTLPHNSERLLTAARAVLNLLDSLPSRIAHLLIGGVCRALMGDADFAVHLAGSTGVFKSEIAALAQQFFGSAMNRTNLPGAWSSTGNSLEAVTFYAKDVLLVIDDFAPHGATSDVARYHANAERVFRAIGNRADRRRLDSSARFREPRPPRAFVLSTGEEIPRGQSIRARLFIAELLKGEVDGTVLKTCQTDARDGLYCELTAGFVQWIAPVYEQKQADFKKRSLELRDQALRNAAHARTPDIISGLQASLELFFDFLRTLGVIDSAEYERRTHASWRILRELAAVQSKYQVDSEPTARFLGLLQSCLISGQAHLAGRDGGVPESGVDCGWVHEAAGWSPKGRRIGWAFEGRVYLDQMAAHQVVQIAGRESGEALAISESTLAKRLKEKGLLVSTSKSRGTLTIRKKIAGSSKIVLALRWDTVFSSDDRSADEDEAA
jgi:hypothetical protein